MTGTLVPQSNTVEAFLAKVGGDYVAAYNEILADENAKALAIRPRSNAETRKLAYAKAIAKQDKGQLKSLNDTLKGFLKLADAVSPVLEENGPLALKEAEDLMVLVLEAKRMKELAESQIAATRTRVFSALTEEFAASGEEFPEFVAGFIEIPDLGLKFTREGGDRQDPVLDEEKLAELVGPEVWKRVTTVEKIPAHEVRTFNPDLYLEMARTDTALLETLRAALTPGEFGKVSFHQRPMEAPDTPEE